MESNQDLSDSSPGGTKILEFPAVQEWSKGTPFEIGRTDYRSTDYAEVEPGLHEDYGEKSYKIEILRYR